MAKTAKNEYSEKSYEELEKMAEQVMEELSHEDIGLDKASELYQKGKAILKEMEERLEKLASTVTDKIA